MTEQVDPLVARLEDPIWECHPAGTLILVTETTRADMLEAAALLRTQSERIGDALAALEPFIRYADQSIVKTTDDAWVWANRSGSARICDWFGPSDFGRVFATVSRLTAGEKKGGDE